MNQPIASSGADADMEIAEGFSSNIVLSRHRATLVPTLAVIPMQDDINYGHRLNPYSSSSSYTTVGLPGTVGDARQFGNEVLPHLRHHRKSSILGQSSERYGRTRNSYDSLSYRMNALANEERAHGSWNDEEEYKEGQSIGRLNCRHDFHSRCIKKWLLIKNACPICKSAALGDKVKGKQVLLM
ncbi:E3 ubiquitin ligase BIG BROTHER [Dendrobium catenatum]|uniref:RING-type E3 ubiquitin transferase n=1 Tax=Dendrobium catenatum TaxID=906689 RepID=A0A2I0VPA6_9ASPA|nr:E3 ubiquitin ligase BIG BROTHER [Dendrobium catenatum]